uniref:Uncharacterized protein n=1 Tax=Schistosoma japonicum TaxID=6182 RepID=Q5BY25_SCHJA|nr:unknown [Schistosoma japonicum]
MVIHSLLWRIFTNSSLAW